MVRTERRDCSLLPSVTLIHGIGRTPLLENRVSRLDISGLVFLLLERLVPLRIADGTYTVDEQTAALAHLTIGLIDGER